jgi:integrase
VKGGIIVRKKKQIKPLKRCNGHGSVYKLSGRRRKPWVAVITKGYTMINGKVKQERKILDTFEHEYQAKDALDRYRLSLNPTEPVLTMTLGEAYEMWSKNKFKDDISKSTKDGIKASWKKLVTLENRQFSGIRSDEFQDVMDYYRDVENASESSLTKLKSLIYALCDYAYHNGLLKTNYSSLIKVGKVETSEREAFTDLEVEIFKKNVDKIPWVDTILVLCYTGMRPIEMLSLTKFNVDMGRKLIIGGVKTDAGKDRIVPIHPLIFPIFQKWYNKNGETIFCNEQGKKLSVRAYREKRFAPALQELKIRPLTPYSCRHTFATMMNRVKAPSANIQKLIGHVVGSSTTDKVYTHPEIEDLRQTIEMLS